jgi:hypothetical protein
MAGSLLQNLGRRPTTVRVSGVATGAQALATLQKLDDKFRSGSPVPFVADILADADIQDVLIEDLRVLDLAGKPQRFSYTLTLREFIKPVDPAPTPPDADIAGDALGRVKDLVDQIPGLPDLTTGLEHFVPQFSSLLARLKAASKQ